MGVRWVIALVIVLWFAYQAVAPHLGELLMQHGMHLKFALCIALCLAVLLMPSLDATLNRNRDVVQHFVMHLQDSAGPRGGSADSLKRMTEGSRIAAEADPRADLQPDAPPAPAPTPPARRRPRAQLGDIERRTVAARQQWKCGKCASPLSSDYRVWVPDEAAIAELSTALCPQCFEQTVVHLHLQPR